MREITEFNFRKVYAVYPTSAIVATAYDGINKAVMSLVWHTPLSFNPPLYGISVSPHRFSHDIFLRARSFAVHYFHHKYSEFVEKVGTTSGRDINKYEQFKIEHFISPLNNPIIKFAFLVLDCYYIEHHIIGDHTLIVGEVKRIYYDPNYVVERGEYLLLKDKSTVLYAGMGEYITTDASSLVRLRR